MFSRVMYLCAVNWVLEKANFAWKSKITLFFNLENLAAIQSGHKIKKDFWLGGQLVLQPLLLREYIIANRLMLFHGQHIGPKQLHMFVLKI